MTKGATCPLIEDKISGGKMPATRKISIRLTEAQYSRLELLVEIGEYTSVSEAIRAAIKKFIEDHKEQIEKASHLRDLS
ncbi:MAG: antitoxin ParD1/3/4 [Archaeoglobaceae archaeon]|nr:antitoxin ParD1/3/4 [Archaeoglobaceae archaeon]MDK2875937.1 antitoxin ParD1/3/4 [Archaeoglobaceae archaeon]